MCLYRYTKSDSDEFFRLAKAYTEPKKTTLSPNMENMMKRWKALGIIRSENPNIHMKTPGLSNMITEVTKTL